MIIKKKSDNFNNSFRSSKKNQDILYESKKRKKVIIKKAKFNLEGNLPIKVNLANKNPKNEKQNDLNASNNNISLMSSFYLRKSFQNSAENKSNTSSSFHKKNIKMINVLNNNNIEYSNKQHLEKGNYNEDNDKNSTEKKGGISKLKEFLSATKEKNNNYNNIFKTENIPIRNIKKFETKNNESKNVINENSNNNNLKNNIRNILTIGFNKNIDKEKIYDLICEKRNSKNRSTKKDIYYKTEIKENNSTKNNINNINDTNNESIYKNWQNSNYKMKNILAKNFIISDDNNNNIRKNRSPNKLKYNDSLINSKVKENGNENEITSLQSNNSKDTLKKTNSSNTKTTTSNITEKVNNLKNFNSELNNYFNLNDKHKQNMKLKSSFQYNDEIANVKSLIFNSPQKWNDNSDNGLENTNFYNPNVTINFNRNKKRIDLNNKIDSNKSVELKNKLKKFKYLNEFENKNQNKKINNDEKDKISINFDELIIFEEIINDISIVLTKYNTLEEEYMNNKSLEFFEFYINSSLYNKFSSFFSEENFIIIQSSINLLLFIIMLIYYLSNNSEILNNYISILNAIFNKLKINLYLIVRKIELYYNNSKFFDLKENKAHFNKIINKFKNSNIYDIKDLNEEDIILKINDNCTNISNNIHKIMNKYFDYSKNNVSTEKNYYNEFLNIFNQISLMTESNITNFFYNNINKKYNNNDEDKKLNKMNNIFLNYKNFNSSMKNRKTIKQNKTDINYSNYKNINSFTKDINSNTDLNELDFNLEEKNIKNKYISIYRINEQNKNNNILNINKSIDDNYFQDSNFIPPFIRNEKPKNKRYTLILDLDETLVHVERINQQINNNYSCNKNDQKVINLRPGLFSFLNSIKPYYEIISFSTASKIYADNIVKKIETNQKYFDYNLYRDHTTLYGKEYVKDISKIGRNIKEVIIVDNLEKNFKLNPDNGIKIAPYFGEMSADDTKLFELQKLLILFNKLKYDDLRMAIKDYKQYIKNKISI